MDYFEPGYTFLNTFPTELEWDWMEDIRNIYEVYEAITTPRFTVPNPRLRSPRLPREICMLVIDHIGIEMTECFNANVRGFLIGSLVKTLWSCSLSCHAFLNHSRPHLYGHVTLTTHSAVKSFLAGIRQDTHLQGLTRDLVLITPDVKAYHQILLHGQALLSKLEFLRLQDMPVLNPRLISQRHPFPSLTGLNLWNCKFTSVIDLRRLIDNFFPNLFLLYVLHLELTSSYVALPDQWPRKVVSLSSLDVLGVGASDPIERWLTSTPTQTSIRLLNIPPSRMKMLLSFGQNIEDLGIHSDNNLSYDLNEAISFGPHLLPTLKSLCLTLRNDEEISQLCTMFSRCHPSPTLTTIQLRFENTVSMDAYSNLDNELSILPPHTHIAVAIELWKSLPKLMKKGMLVAPSSGHWWPW